MSKSDRKFQAIMRDAENKSKALRAIDALNAKLEEDKRINAEIEELRVKQRARRARSLQMFGENRGRPTFPSKTRFVDLTPEYTPTKENENVIDGKRPELLERKLDISEESFQIDDLEEEVDNLLK